MNTHGHQSQPRNKDKIDTKSQNKYAAEVQRCETCIDINAENLQAGCITCLLWLAVCRSVQHSRPGGS